MGSSTLGGAGAFVPASPQNIEIVRGTIGCAMASDPI
jgi:hypothetical protein